VPLTIIMLAYNCGKTWIVESSLIIMKETASTVMQ